VPQTVRIDVYDATGAWVTTLAKGKYPAGDFGVRWEGGDAAGREVATGIYLVTFKAGKLTESRKLLLLK
jgi:flagellar hook assembly protein FlgD